jgi:hypothetical protein
MPLYKRRTPKCATCLPCECAHLICRCQRTSSAQWCYAICGLIKVVDSVPHVCVIIRRAHHVRRNGTATHLRHDRSWYDQTLDATTSGCSITVPVHGRASLHMVAWQHNPDARLNVEATILISSYRTLKTPMYAESFCHCRSVSIEPRAFPYDLSVRLVSVAQYISHTTGEYKTPLS